jgi:hypothetical protein
MSWLHPFENIFEAFESTLPEGTVVADPIDQGREGSRLRAVVGFASFTAMANESGAFESGEMFGDHGLRDAGALGQGMHGLLAVAGETLEDSPSRWVGESFEEIVRGDCHEQNHNHIVMVCQAKSQSWAGHFSGRRRWAVP